MRFFSQQLLLRMPNSIRPLLASLFLQVLVRLTEDGSELVEEVAKALACIPDALLVSLKGVMGLVVKRCLPEPTEACGLALAALRLMSKV